MLKKIKPSYLFDGYKFRKSGSVLIMHPTGQVVDIVDSSEAGDDGQEVAGTITPGFVNSHCHLELSHMLHQIPEHTGLPSFLLSVMRQRSFPSEVIKEAMLKADNEMHQQGIVAVGDICNTIQSIEVKSKSKILYYNFVETMGVVGSKAMQRFQQASVVKQAFENKASANFIGQSIVPHAPYSVSSDLFALIAQAAEKKVISIHSQESAAETELLQNGTGDFLNFFREAGLPFQEIISSTNKQNGNCSLQVMDKFQQNHLLFVHNVETTPNDLAFAFRNFNPALLFWCICAQANEYISNKLPDIPMLEKNDIQLVIGTDSLASNHQLSIVSEINCIRKHHPGLSLEKILQWATINGAKALQIENRIGSFEPGKTPGVVLIPDSWQQSTRLL